MLNMKKAIAAVGALAMSAGLLGRMRFGQRRLR